MRRLIVGLVALAAFPLLAHAEPYVSTTANQAEAIAPWEMWWLGLALFSFVAYPALGCLLLRYFKAGTRANVILVFGLGAAIFFAGAAMIIAMVAVSIAYSKTSPLAFVGVWFAATSLLTLGLAWYLRSISARRPQ